MADREKVKMYINIAGERIRLTVDYDEQDAVREAESQVVRLFDEWRQMFPKKTVPELLAMIAYQFAMYYMALRHRQDDMIAQLKDFEKNIDIALEETDK
ncbi:MAG: cell division protein ZapA [Muribaculaceae bacterium]|nr:cell division protein ZapA [Muribaculaceae bacterium]